MSRFVCEKSISGSEIGSWIDLSNGVWLADDPGALFDLPWTGILPGIVAVKRQFFSPIL